ncbi:MAG: hypothetical protein AB7O24_03585 [Kofleriaceae bacterium]
MAERTINTRRRIVFSTCLDAVAAEWSKLGSIAHRRNDRFSLHPDETTEVLFHLSSVKRGFAKTEFGSYFGMIYRGGAIYELLRRAGLESRSPDHRIVLMVSHNIPRCGDRGVYNALLATDLERLGKGIASDVRRTVSPLVEALANASPDVLTLLGAEGVLAGRPFAIGAAVLALSGRITKLEAFWRRTQRSKKFFDRPAAQPELIQLRRTLEAALDR